MRGAAGARLWWTFRARRRDARHRDATRNFWARRSRWRRTRQEPYTRYGMQAGRTAGRSACSFLLRLPAEGVGPRRRMYRLRVIPWNIVFLRSLRALLATCVLHGWTRATLRCGMSFSAARAMAALHGRLRCNSRVERATLIVLTITFGRMASASLSAIISQLPSITSGTRTRCGARGGTLSLRDRSG